MYDSGCGECSEAVGDPGGVEADAWAERLGVDGVEDLVGDGGEAGADDLGAFLLQHGDHLVKLERLPGLAHQRHVHRRVLLLPHLHHRQHLAVAFAVAGGGRRAATAAIAGAGLLAAPQLVDARLELLDVRRRAVQLIQLRRRVL